MSDKIPNYLSEPPLSKIEHVRLRPGMYFGGTDQRALHQVVWEVLENAIEQAHRGFCDRIEVTLRDDHTISISDNGMGIPVELYKDTERQVLEIIMTESGARYYDPVAKRFPELGSLFGAGLVAVNAVSAEITVQTKWDGFVWQQRYAQGQKQSEIEKLRELSKDDRTGTTITFKPDFNILEPNDFDYDWIYRQLREIAAAIPGLSTILLDRRTSSAQEDVEFRYSSLTAYVEFLNRDAVALHPLLDSTKQLEIPERGYGRKPYNAFIELVLQYTQSSENLILSLVNGRAVDGGKHVWGFFNALLRVVNHFAYQEQLVPNNWYFARDHLMDGLTVVFNIWHTYPSFESQINVKLINPETEHAAYDMTDGMFEDFATQHPNEMRRIIEKCLANKARREQRRYGR